MDAHYHTLPRRRAASLLRLCGHRNERAFGEDRHDHFVPREHPIMTVWRGIPQPNQGGIDQGLSKDCLSRSEPV